MNIVYYLESFPALSKSFILNEIYELRQKGHQIAVCARVKPDQNIVHEEFNELDIPIEYIRLSYRDVPELLSPTTVNPRILRNAIYPASPKAHLANLVRAKRSIEFVDSLDWEPEHFHTHFATPQKFGGLYAASYYEVPFTITTHSYDLYGETVGAYTRSLLQHADRIVTISEYNSQYIRSRFEPETPIDVVRAGIRPEKFSPSRSTEPSRVLTVSRLVEKKGLQYAIEAASKAVERVPDIEYHIIGSGDLKPKLVEKTKQAGLEDNVDFLDNVSDERLLRELDEARCFLLPSVIASSGDRDGIPVALMEAMAMKTPPVSTTVSGIPELIEHERNGLLSEPRNAEALCEDLIAVLENELTWTAYAERARETVVNKFNIEIEAQKLESTFKNARA